MTGLESNSEPRLERIVASLRAITGEANGYRTSESACYRGAMALERTSFACRQVVIDDRCRLFGRFCDADNLELARPPSS